MLPVELVLIAPAVELVAEDLVELSTLTMLASHGREAVGWALVTFSSRLKTGRRLDTVGSVVDAGCDFLPRLCAFL